MRCNIEQKDKKKKIKTKNLMDGESRMYRVVILLYYYYVHVYLRLTGTNTVYILRT